MTCDYTANLTQQSATEGLREILQTILIHVVKDAKPLEYFHTLFHHHALQSVTTLLYHDSEFGDSKLI